MRRVAREWAVYAVARPAMLAAEILPRAASAAMYANASLALCALSPRLRRRAFRGVRLAFPGIDQTAARRLVIASFRAIGRSASDVPRLRRMSGEALRDLVTIRGLEKLERALSRRRGVVGIAPHLGNWEILAAALAARGIPLTAVAAELYDPRLGRYVVSARERWGVGTIMKGTPGATREALSVLHRGEMLGTLIDLHTRDDGITVPFLGRASHMASGPIRLALRTGAAVVPMAIVRASDDRYVAEIREPLRLDDTGDASRDLEQGVRSAATALEAFIRENPEQWLWIHNRWPTEAAPR
jgi:KDO2-lipid IV(A) lauroyltransferase